MELVLQGCTVAVPGVSLHTNVTANSASLNIRAPVESVARGGRGKHLPLARCHCCSMPLKLPLWCSCRRAAALRVPGVEASCPRPSTSAPTSGTGPWKQVGPPAQEASAWPISSIHLCGRAPCSRPHQRCSQTASVGLSKKLSDTLRCCHRRVPFVHCPTHICLTSRHSGSLLCLAEIITDDNAVSWKLTANDLKEAADKACKASLKELKTLFPDVSGAELLPPAEVTRHDVLFGCCSAAFILLHLIPDGISRPSCRQARSRRPSCAWTSPSAIACSHKGSRLRQTLMSPWSRE